MPRLSFSKASVCLSVTYLSSPLSLLDLASRSNNSYTHYTPLVVEYSLDGVPRLVPHPAHDPAIVVPVPSLHGQTPALPTPSSSPLPPMAVPAPPPPRLPTRPSSSTYSSSTGRLPTLPTTSSSTISPFSSRVISIMSPVWSTARRMVRRSPLVFSSISPAGSAWSSSAPSAPSAA